jgi:hypothetical protein
MSSDRHDCPTCGRPFLRVFDYPRIEVLRFERLPLPEAIDDMSAAAAERQLARRRQGAPPEVAFGTGINMTPEIERACNAPEMHAYFEQLNRLTGQRVAPHELQPPFPANSRFKAAYLIPGSSLSLGLHDPEAPTENAGCVVLDVMCPGPNLGSAGGPTLQVLGGIARLEYRGITNPA